MSMLSLEHYSERQRRAVERIVGTLSEADHRSEARYLRYRRHPRKQFSGPVLICLASELEEASEDHPTTFQAFSYNISQGGIGLLIPARIPAERVCVGLRLPNGELRWMDGRVTRVREIPEEEFLDCGIAFVRAARPVGS
jgi:hypothetical protein